MIVYMRGFSKNITLLIRLLIFCKENATSVYLKLGMLFCRPTISTQVSSRYLGNNSFSFKICALTAHKAGYNF